MSLIPPFANELVLYIVSFADLDSLIKLTQVSRGVRTLVYSTSTTFLIWLHGYQDVRETTESDLNLGHHLFRHGKRAMGPQINRTITLECPHVREFHLFLDGFLLQSMEHPEIFAFHWAPSPLGVKSLSGDPAQVDLGPGLVNPTLEAVSPDYMAIVWDDPLARSTNIRVVDLENGVRAGDCITGFDYCDYSFDFLQDAVVALSIHKNWLGIFSESKALHRQEIHILNLHPWTDGEPVLVASSYFLNTRITGFSLINERFFLVGTSGALLVFKYSVPGRKQPILRLRVDERITGMWVQKSPAILFPKLSTRDFVPAKTGRELLVIRLVTPAPGVSNKPRGHSERVLISVIPIFDILTEKYPPGTTLSPNEWKRFILRIRLGYPPLSSPRENMDPFVSGTRMVLPVGQVDNGRVEYIEYNFDQHWAMFVNWMAQCGDEEARKWTIKKRGPFIVSSRPFYVPKGHKVLITDDYTVFSPDCTPGITVYSSLA